MTFLLGSLTGGFFGGMNEGMSTWNDIERLKYMQAQRKALTQKTAMMGKLPAAAAALAPGAEGSGAATAAMPPPDLSQPVPNSPLPPPSEPGGAVAPTNLSLAPMPNYMAPAIGHAVAPVAPSNIPATTFSEGANPAKAATTGLAGAAAAAGKAAGTPLPKPPPPAPIQAPAAAPAAKAASSPVQAPQKTSSTAAPKYLASNPLATAAMPGAGPKPTATPQPGTAFAGMPGNPLQGASAAATPAQSRMSAMKSAFAVPTLASSEAGAGANISSAMNPTQGAA